MHRHPALGPLPGAEPEAAARQRRAVIKSAILGAALQGVAAPLVHLVPLFRSGNLYPVLATLIGACTGHLYQRAARGGPLGGRLRGGAVAAGSSGMVGTLLFALLGDLPFQIVPTAVITCAVAGGLGALPGSMRPPAPD